jgi:menaquinone-dependent protoporphyrinogen oxidase
MQHVLVTWGSKMGGTQGIARIIGSVLTEAGFEVTLAPARSVRRLEGFDAAVIGGALYANRWHRDAYRFVSRNMEALRRIPVWLFSSGPLDDSADREEIPPAPLVGVLLERVGAQGHTTFGGRLDPDATGFIAASMAKKLSGDWRNPERIRAWAANVADAIPTARPRPAVDPPARSWPRLLLYAAVGWGVCAGLAGSWLAVASPGVALTLHVLGVPIVFTAVASRYFHGHGARDPLPAAVGFTVFSILLAALLATFLFGSFAIFTSIAATWLPFGLVFLSTWLTGLLMSTMPWPKSATPPPRA